jgi:hypothetical protein
VLGESPHFFRAHLEAICTPMLVIIRQSTLEDATRKLALEFLLVLAETAGGTVRKLPRLIEAILSLSLSFLMTDVDADELAGLRPLAHVRIGSAGDLPAPHPMRREEGVSEGHVHPAQRGGAGAAGNPGAGR